MCLGGEVRASSSPISRSSLLTVALCLRIPPLAREPPADVNGGSGAGVKITRRLSALRCSELTPLATGRAHKPEIKANAAEVSAACTVGALESAATNPRPPTAQRSSQRVYGAPLSELLPNVGQVPTDPPGVRMKRRRSPLAFPPGRPRRLASPQYPPGARRDRPCPRPNSARVSCANCLRPRGHIVNFTCSGRWHLIGNSDAMTQPNGFRISVLVRR
ncbi:unnamed protein product, partial [Iphiclides podalirius]